MRSNQTFSITPQNYDADENPVGLDGFSFVEFSSPDIPRLKQQFSDMGFVELARHRTKNVWLYVQNQIRFVINAEPNSQAQMFAKAHGAGACAMGFRVSDPVKAQNHCIKLGAEPFEDGALPAIWGIGGSVIYFVQATEEAEIFRDAFAVRSELPDTFGLGLQYIDHLTHNVYKGHLDEWAQFYERLFNFREIRFFDIEGAQTGLFSRAMTAPDDKIRIPLNETKDENSQIQEFLDEFRGEGIQHIALSTDDIYETVEAMHKTGLRFLDVPDTYFDAINQRVPGHEEDIARLAKNGILIDGDPANDKGLLLQIFTQNMLGPVFFEIIQRKGNEGFGEGNFTALFEAIERDQVQRGVLKESK